MNIILPEGIYLLTDATVSILHVHINAIVIMALKIIPAIYWNTILRKLSDEDDEDILRHCDFIDRWLDWNANQEIWARTMSSWKQIMGDEDPYLFHISEETRANLEEAAKSIQDF